MVQQMWTGLEVSRAWEESPGELQSSASYCKVLHNLGQGPRVVLAWLIADGPASTPRSRLGSDTLDSTANQRPARGLSRPIAGHGALTLVRA